MYKNFFGLSRNPFDLTPDPDCFVPTARHNEALTALYHGVRRHKGFIVVTGEVGTGKTLLVRCLIGLLKESRDIGYAYIYNGRLSPTEFLQYILSDFGLPASGRSKYELLLDLGRFLMSRGSQGMTTVLIVDEAHHLSAEILEEVRLLSNLETTSDKLLQIVLVGQPELDEKLDSYELRQLKQRIAIRTHLQALDEGETRQYIEQRLMIAGRGKGCSQLFPDQAVTAVYLYSRGLPRLINTICENSLVAAYARRLSEVTPEVVESIAKEFRLDVVYPSNAESIGEQSELDVDRALKLLRDLYAIRREHSMDQPASGSHRAAQESKHERYF